MAYLNRADREVIVCIAGCVGLADSLIEKRFRNSDRVKEELAKMRDTAQGIINTIMEGVDPDQCRSVMRFASVSEVMVVPNSDPRLDKHYAVVDKRDVETIISSVVGDCVFCEKEGQEARKCELRKALLGCGMVSDENSVMPASQEDCPFRG